MSCKLFCRYKLIQIYFFQISGLRWKPKTYSHGFHRLSLKVTLGGHSALDPPLPISNRVVKRSRADDSVFSHAKVGHCQAPYKKPRSRNGAFFFAPSMGALLRNKSRSILLTANEAKHNCLYEVSRMRGRKCGGKR